MIGFLARPGSSHARIPDWRRYVERATVREVLMGAQDNLTNVLAVVLGVTIGTGRADFVALAGLSAGIAEAISMGGVLYNSTRAELRFTRDDAEARPAPVMSGLITFAAALVAGLIPLIPFILLPVGLAVIVSLGASIFGLFVLGSLTGRISGDAWIAEGVRLVIVAGLAAAAAALIGVFLQVA